MPQRDMVYCRPEPGRNRVAGTQSGTTGSFNSRVGALPLQNQVLGVTVPHVGRFISFGFRHMSGLMWVSDASPGRGWVEGVEGLTCVAS
jgi:hypothetical protein